MSLNRMVMSNIFVKSLLQKKGLLHTVLSQNDYVY